MNRKALQETELHIDIQAAGFMIEPERQESDMIQVLEGYLEADREIRFIRKMYSQ